jgi:competence protein ComEA
VPVAAKASGIALLMLGLAGIGATSILSTPGGVSFSAAALPGQASSWLAPAAAPPSAAVEGARTPAPVGPAGYGSFTNLAVRASSPSAVGSSPTNQGENRGAAGVEVGESRAPGITPEGKVILNTATAKELTRLPGVGAKRAVSIVKLRERLKRFRRVTDLLRVRGIGVRRLRRMAPHLVLDPPDSATKEDPG